jgi:hypothetical protein
MQEISKGEELVKEQAKEEDEDDSDCCKMDDQEDQEAEKRLQIATLLIPFDQILMSSVLVYLTGSLSAWESATFFCLFVFVCILGEHFFPNVSIYFKLRISRTNNIHGFLFSLNLNLRLTNFDHNHCRIIICGLLTEFPHLYWVSYTLLDLDALWVLQFISLSLSYLMCFSLRMRLEKRSGRRCRRISTFALKLAALTLV